MKYWLLTTEYPPFHGGGISTYCYYTAEMLAQKGNYVTVFMPDDKESDYRIETDGNISLVKFNTNRKRLYNYLGYSARLSYEFADIVKTIIELKGRPDFIEAQDYLGIAYYIQQFKWTGYQSFQGIPIIITLHSPAFLYLEYNRVSIYKFPDFWTCEMEKQSIIAADHIISPTKFLSGALERYINLSNKKISIIPNPFVVEEVLNKSFQRNKIIYYGKLSPQKGTFELLEYFRELWDEGEGYVLELIGGTDIVYHPELKTMGQLVQEKYKQYIQRELLLVKGKISPAEISKKLQDAHVVIVPSTVDNLPYVVMEAMSLGKVVLASIQGGQREIIENGVNGFLFDHNKKGDFKNQLYKVLSLKDEEVISIGATAIRRIKDTYNYDKIYQQKVNLLDSLQLAMTNTNKFPFLYAESATDSNTTLSNELLSVVIPYYNMGAYVQDAIQSVVQSTYKHIEILIINDGSTEGESLKVLEKLRNNASVTIYNKKNEGLALTRNYGAEIAKGQYLAFLDADDKVDKDYYEKAVHVLKQYENVYFVGAWVKYFGDSTVIWPTYTPQPPYALVHNPVNSSGLVYKKEAFLAGGQNDKAVDYGLEDYESVIAMLHNGFNGVVLPECLFQYRVRKDSMIRSVNTNKLIYSNKYITEKHQAYYTKFAAPIINLLNANGPGYLYDNPTLEVNVQTTIIRPSGFLYRVKNIIKKNKQLKKLALKVKNSLKR